MLKIAEIDVNNIVLEVSKVINNNKQCILSEFDQGVLGIAEFKCDTSRAMVSGGWKEMYFKIFKMTELIVSNS